VLRFRRIGTPQKRDVRRFRAALPRHARGRGVLLGEVGDRSRDAPRCGRKLRALKRSRCITPSSSADDAASSAACTRRSPLRKCALTVRLRGPIAGFRAATTRARLDRGGCFGLLRGCKFAVRNAYNVDVQVDCDRARFRDAAAIASTAASSQRQWPAFPALAQGHGSSKATRRSAPETSRAGGGAIVTLPLSSGCATYHRAVERGTPRSRRGRAPARARERHSPAGGVCRRRRVRCGCLVVMRRAERSPGGRCAAPLPSSPANAVDRGDSSDSSGVIGGRIEGMRRASIVLPQGRPDEDHVVSAAAAISSARFAMTCPARRQNRRRCRLIVAAAGAVPTRNFARCRADRNGIRQRGHGICIDAGHERRFSVVRSGTIARECRPVGRR